MEVILLKKYFINILKLNYKLDGPVTNFSHSIEMQA